MEGDPTKPDFYVGSTFGADVLLGFKSGFYSPYIAVGFTDVSTFFYIDDDGIVINNENPYAGLTGSIGVQAQILKNLNAAAELYAVPGNLYTGRMNLSLLFQ